MQNKTLVRVQLTEAELQAVDIYRRDIQLRTGKLPTRATAIARMIREVVPEV